MARHIYCECGTLFYPIVRSLNGNEVAYCPSCDRLHQVTAEETGHRPRRRRRKAS